MHRLFYLWNLWPPFWGAGIKIHRISSNYRSVEVRLKWRPWTRNYIGTQYGGSIFSMADPFYMVILIKNIGKDFSVIDSGADVSFLKLGKSELVANFSLRESDFQEIRKALPDSGDRMIWEREIPICDLNGEKIALVKKRIRIKKR